MTVLGVGVCFCPGLDLGPVAAGEHYPERPRIGCGAG